MKLLKISLAMVMCWAATISTVFAAVSADKTMLAFNANVTTDSLKVYFAEGDTLFPIAADPVIDGPFVITPTGCPVGVVTVDNVGAGSCDFAITYTETAGSHSFLYEITDGTNTIPLFLSNYNNEPAGLQAERRMPAVVEKLTVTDKSDGSVVSTLTNNKTYTVTYYVATYGEEKSGEQFNAQLSVYDCGISTDCLYSTNGGVRGELAEDAGLSLVAKSNFGTKVLDVEAEGLEQYYYKGEALSHFKYEAEFTTTYTDPDTLVESDVFDANGDSVNLVTFRVMGFSLHDYEHEHGVRSSIVFATNLAIVKNNPTVTYQSALSRRIQLQGTP